jgi:hypothetical protein
MKKHKILKSQSNPEQNSNDEAMVLGCVTE